MQADSEANNRVKGLSKPEWVLLGLTLGLLICGDIGFTVIQIGEFYPFLTLGDWKSALITALVCVALASVKPRSYVEVETVGERLLWAAKYVGFFFNIFYVWERNLRGERQSNWPDVLYRDEFLYLLFGGLDMFRRD